MKTSTFFKQSILCMTFGFMTLVLNAQIITIDNNPGSTTTYQTIQDALDNAPSGATIYVQPSNTTYGNAEIKNPITIVGRSHSELGKISTLGAISIRSGAVELKGLFVSNITYSLIGAPIAPPFVGLRVYECEVSSTFNLGTFNVPADDVVVSGSILRAGIFVDNTASNVEISNNIILSSLSTEQTQTLGVHNNIFRGTSSITVSNNDPADGTLILFDNMFILNSNQNRFVNLNNGPFNLTNNLIHNYDANLNFLPNASGSFSDTGTISADPLFENIDDSVGQSFAGTSSAYDSAFRPEDDLTLKAGSPALTTGTGGEQIGLFNSGFNFEKLGNPRGLPALDITNYDGAVPKNGNINVTITSKAY